jgi:hypothetical protein
MNVKDVKHIGTRETDTEGTVFVEVEVIFEDCPPLRTGVYYNWRDDHIDLSRSPELAQGVHGEVLTAIVQHIEEHEIMQICESASADAQNLFEILGKDIVTQIEDFEPFVEERFNPEKLKVPDNWTTRSAYIQSFCEKMRSLSQKATYTDKGYDLGGHHLDLF